MAYIEENMKLRRGEMQDEEDEEGPADPYAELFRLNKAKAAEKEEGNVTNSLAMLTAIPEVDLGMEYVGDAAPGDQTVRRGDENEFIIFWLREGRITAAANVNIWDVNDTLRALVGRAIPAARLEDPSIELGEL